MEAAVEPSLAVIPPEKHEQLSRKRAIVADDDPSARRILAATLRSMGFEVVEIADGGRMLVAVASQYKNGHSPTEVDLIVTDVHMPVVDGLEIFRELRAASWTTPTIVVTGDDAPQIHDTAARLGATVLPKPLDLDAFEAAVRQQLRRREGAALSRHS